MTAMNFSAFTIRSVFEASSVRQLAALGFAFTLFSCAPGEVKDGLGPDETAAAAVEVTPERSSIVVGEAVLVRASARSSSGQPAPAQVEWTADGGTLVALTDSTAQFSAASAGTYKIRGRGKKSPNPQDSTVIVVNPPPVSPIVSLSVSPNPASVPTGGMQVFSASATRQDGTTLVPSVTWSATGGSISASGVYTAGGAAGSFSATATLVGGSLTATVPVTVSAVVSPIVSIVVSPATATVNSGATRAFTASATRQDGSTLVPSVTWSATGGTISAGGVYTAGASSGTYRVVGVLQGGTLADTSVVTIPAPVLQAVVLMPSSVSLATGATQQFSVSGQWSNGSTNPPAVTYAATGGSITTGGLYTAGSTAGTFRVVAIHEGGSLADTAAVVISSATGTVLVSEDFETGNLSSHGWFDATTVAITSDSRPGSAGTHALQWHWAPGTVTPQGVSRIDFAPSTSVYLSYWVKQSSSWVGSGVAYHPHMFYFLTTADDHWIGPSRTHLTLYDELLYVPARGGSVANLVLQDALMIDPNNLMVDLTNVSEQRAIGGYNGRPEPGLVWDAYDAGGGQYTNYKMLRPTAIVMTDATKTSWHHVESYWRLNSIAGGKGQPDGIVQYWFDGALLVDRHDVYFRTNANSTMMFRTFLMGPYIGVGSPVDQYMWIDDLSVRTSPP